MASLGAEAFDREDAQLAVPIPDFSRLEVIWGTVGRFRLVEAGKFRDDNSACRGTPRKSDGLST
jgi:hypothetical protein